jgi:N-acetylmuramoyl-L-alanine amidase
VIAGALVAAAMAAGGMALAGATVHLDAGHNGANGAHPAQIGRLVPAGRGGFRKACDTAGTQTEDGRLSEAAFNLDVALRMRRRLQALGARVVMTRTTNDGVGPCVNERAAIGNRARADLALSIHADGGPRGGRGFHVIAPRARRAVAPSVVATSLRFARSVRGRLRAIGLPAASYVGGDGLGGLNLSRVPKGVRRARQHAQRRRRAPAAPRRPPRPHRSGALRGDRADARSSGRHDRCGDRQNRYSRSCAWRSSASSHRRVTSCS